MGPAEEYLHNRLDKLTEDRTDLIEKINQLDIEIEETEYSIKDLEARVDDAFEIFSPRTKKNDFVKKEIDRFKERLSELLALKDEYSEQANSLLNDINILSETLTNAEEKACNENHLNDEQKQDLEDDDFKDEKADDSLIKGLRILEKVENENSRLALNIQDNIIQSITNLVHKCEICSRVVEVDTIRTKIEIEVMSNVLKEILEKLRQIVFNLSPFNENENSVKNAVKKICLYAKKTYDINVTANVEGEENYPDRVYPYAVIRIFTYIIELVHKWFCAIDLKCDIINHDNVIEIKTVFESENENSNEEYINSEELSSIEEMVGLFKGIMDISKDEKKNNEVTILILFEV